MADNQIGGKFMAWDASKLSPEKQQQFKQYKLMIVGAVFVLIFYFVIKYIL